jgi:hypothetical protein
VDTQAASRAAPGQPHVLIVEQLDGSTSSQATRQPRELLARLGTVVTIGRTIYRPGARAATVANLIRERVGAAAGEAVVWLPFDFEDLAELLDEYDLATGQMVKRAGVRLADPVQVSRLGRGVVTGFTRCGRVIVLMDHPRRGVVECTAIAPRAHVKPVVRA